MDPLLWTSLILAVSGSAMLACGWLIRRSSAPAVLMQPELLARLSSTLARAQHQISMPVEPPPLADLIRRHAAMLSSIDQGNAAQARARHMEREADFLDSGTYEGDEEQPAAVTGLMELPVREQWQQFSTNAHRYLAAGAAVLPGFAWSDLYQELARLDAVMGADTPELPTITSSIDAPKPAWQPVWSALTQLEAADVPAPLLAALRAALEPVVDQVATDDSGGDDRERELKELILQFTKDSREMLACIRRIEEENTQLRQLISDHAAPA